ncbi:GTPase-activating protein [Agyrium rufum]|nr:GTPase-activating protein [Agyrium rufum]
MSARENQIESADSSDREGDTFEDASELRPDLKSRTTSNASGRSLTSRHSEASTTRSLTDRHDFISPSKRPVPTSAGTMSTDTEPDTVVGPAAAGSGMNGTTVNGGKGKEKETPSPLLTAHKVSTFDDVQLGDGAEESDARGRSESKSSIPSIRSPSQSTASPLNSRPGSQAPARPEPPPAASSTGWTAPQISRPQIPTNVSRKISSPFSWFGRQKSGPAATDPSPPPPLPGKRRNTAASNQSAGGLPTDLIITRLDEERSPGFPPRPHKDSLRERFKSLRMREEVGIHMDEAELQGKTGEESGTGLGIGSTGHVLEGEENVMVNSPANMGQSDGHASLNGALSRTKSLPDVDLKLAPGTVSGISAGPSVMQDPESPVDWDLWQSVVYEGPTAVAKTSAAELNRAIASGIPSAIRGVVWQVLAQSKNEELEGVYRELVVRGTDKEMQSESPKMPNGPLSATSLRSNSTVKESLTSSSSSIHSETSTPGTANDMLSPSPPDPMEAEKALKLQAASTAERQKQLKEEQAAIKKLEKTIRKDLGARSNYSKYTAAAGLQEALFGVCKAYALFDEGVGYAQGMNFIVMPLLFNMPEEEAFCLLVRLMNQYHLRDMFTMEMPGLHLHLYQFERLLEDHEPALCYHLKKRGVDPSLYATQWFLTLFAYRFPLQLVLRVYDLILSEGLGTAILRFGIAVMQKNADALLAIQDMSALKTFLNERLFDAYINQAPSATSILESGFFGSAGGSDKDVYRADVLVQEACAVNIDPQALKTYASDYETRKRMEKEREEELDSLRSGKASYVLKIRSLEERAQKSDADHVQMATEMIRSKMENEELRNTNEELRAEVAALKKVVETQPAEVEAKLKEEMDRILKRNIAVQNENRLVEEQMADMERDLVNAKLAFAELNSEHETLRQKWADLKKALE